MRQLLLNRFHCRRPDKGFWSSFRAARNRNRLFQVFHAAEGSTSDSFGSEFSKPPFHKIQPTGTRRHKVGKKRGCPLSQACTLGCCVSRSYPSREQRGLAGKLLVQPSQKLSEFLVPVPIVALANDLALEDLQSGKERGRAIAFVVVSHSAATAFFKRQARLRSIQSLNLALLIHTEHQGLLRRVQK